MDEKRGKRMRGEETKEGTKREEERRLGEEKKQGEKRKRGEEKRVDTKEVRRLQQRCSRRKKKVGGDTI